MGPWSAVEETGIVAGHRLVRRIGVGSRSDVYLGVAREPGSGPEAGPRAEPATAALKLFRHDVDGAAVDRQVHAMLTLPPGVLVRLDDVATAPDGRLCLVLDRLPGPSLGRLLAGRGGIRPGEAVTIAATVTATLGLLHEAGLSQPTILPDRVRFDASGRPVLLGLGALEDLPAGAAGVPRRRDDLLGLAGFLRCLLDHLEPGEAGSGSAGAVLAAFEEAVTSRPLIRNLDGLEAALFDWAPATAVRGAGQPAGAAAGAAAGGPVGPVRVVSTVGVVSTLPPARSPGQLLSRPPGPPALPGGVDQDAPCETAVAGPRAAVRRVLLVVRRLAERPFGTPGDGGSLAGRLRAGLVDRARALTSGRALPVLRGPIRRRPVLVGLGLTVVLVGGGVAGLSAIAPRSSVGAADGQAGGRPASGSATPEPAGRPAGADPAEAALLGDDPAAAVLSLLRLRDECVRAGSVLCLDGVDQAGSVAMAADVYQARQGGTGATGRLGDGLAGLRASVQERTGNSALVVLSSGDPTGAGGSGVGGSVVEGSVVEGRGGEVGGGEVGGGERREPEQPASALVIKGEAGWRLRELFDY